MSNEARLRLAAVTDEAQKSFCQNTLLKIALSDPETQKTKHLESPAPGHRKLDCPFDEPSI
jgi:hypothetical protein